MNESGRQSIPSRHGSKGAGTDALRLRPRVFCPHMTRDSLGDRAVRPSTPQPLRTGNGEWSQKMIPRIVIPDEVDRAAVYAALNAFRQDIVMSRIISGIIHTSSDGRELLTIIDELRQLLVDASVEELDLTVLQTPTDDDITKALKAFEQDN